MYSWSRPTTSLRAELGDRTNVLNLVRLVLAAFVIVGHAWPLTGSPDAGLQFLSGIAVNGFFAVSGYLIAASRIRTDLSGFIWRRTLRILPCLIVCALITAFGLAPLVAVVEGTQYVVLDAVNYTVSTSLMLNTFPDIGTTLSTVPYTGVWNGSAWTLQFEFLAYVAVGVLLSVTIVRRHAHVIVSVLGLLAVAAWLVAPDLFSISTNFFLESLRLGSYFLVGSAMYFLGDRLEARGWLALAAGSAFIGLWIVGLDDVLGQVPLAYLLLSAGSLHWRNPTTNNDLSYGLYIYAFPVQQVLVVLGTAQLGVAINVGLTASITAAIAWGSWIFVERPALRLKDARWTMIRRGPYDPAAG